MTNKRNRWGKVEQDRRMNARGTENVHSDSSSAERYLRDVYGLNSRRPVPLDDIPTEEPKQKLYDYVVYRPKKNVLGVFKLTGSETNTEVAQKIADRENQNAKREWTQPIQVGDFNYFIVKGQPDLEAATTEAKSRIKELPHESPYKRRQRLQAGQQLKL